LLTLRAKLGEGHRNNQTPLSLCVSVATIERPERFERFERLFPAVILFGCGIHERRGVEVRAGQLHDLIERSEL
jgi:hypothetical protein